MGFEEIKAGLDRYCNGVVEERRYNELLPCPFCGGTASYVHVKMMYVPKFLEFRVECSQCHASIPATAKTKALAAEKWNRRVGGL